MRMAEFTQLVDDFEATYGRRPEKMYLQRGEIEELIRDLPAGFWSAGASMRLDDVQLIDTGSEWASRRHLTKLVMQHMGVLMSLDEGSRRYSATVPGLWPVDIAISESVARDNPRTPEIAAEALAYHIEQRTPDWHDVHMRTITSSRVAVNRSADRWGLSALDLDAEFLQSMEVRRIPTWTWEPMNRNANGAVLQTYASGTATQTATRHQTYEQLRAAMDAMRAALSPQLEPAATALSDLQDAVRYTLGLSPADQQGPDRTSEG